MKIHLVLDDQYVTVVMMDRYSLTVLFHFGFVLHVVGRVLVRIGVLFRSIELHCYAMAFRSEVQSSGIN